MAYDEGLAQLMRDDLASESQISEKRMFGGLCFFLGGNMLCGVMGAKHGGAMFRVGKENEAKVLTYPGATEMTMTGRRMGGLVCADEDAMQDDDTRRAFFEAALEFVRALPAK